MSAVPADLTITSRWILPMSSPGEVMDNHALVVRDGRILDVQPQTQAAARYAATVTVERPEHLLMPGLVNAHTRIAPGPGLLDHPQRLHDGAQLYIAQMLKAGITSFSALGYFPDASARIAVEQGMRAMIGMPIAESASRWAQNPGDYLTRALELRDEYRGHPTIATAFAPQSPCAISDDTFGRIATLSNELDAGILMALHESPEEVDECTERHGVRPIERLNNLGLLTPAMTAAHMVQVNAQDIALAQRSGIAITLCPEASYRSGHGPPPVAAWASTGLRLSLGSGATGPTMGLDAWAQLRLLDLLSQAPGNRGASLGAWDIVATATRGGAAALGLDADIGTLEKGKWADICCLDLQTPAMQVAALLAPHDPAAQLVLNGGRDLVSDVWVCGRQLLNAGAFTRIDWPQLVARANSWRDLPIMRD
jgi:5-methylthioadenosine/S-adenosylhomocysteine deaminase